MRAFCASSRIGDAALAVSELVTFGVLASEASLAGALHAASATTLAQPAAARARSSCNLDVTVPSEAALVPLQVLGDKYPG